MGGDEEEPVAANAQADGQRLERQVREDIEQGLWREIRQRHSDEMGGDQQSFGGGGDPSVEGQQEEGATLNSVG